MNQILKHLNINEQEFKFQFKSHPNYPSALAFSDTLRFMGINNEAYSLDEEILDSLPNRFITIYKGSFALIENFGKNYKVYSDNVENISHKQFQNSAPNIVILFEHDNAEKIKTSLNYNWLFISILGIVLIFSVYRFTWYQTLYNLLSGLGIYISMELFRRKFGQESALIKNFCGTNAGNSTESSCSKIIDSDKINILGLKLSDFSLIYFLGLLVLGLFFPYTSFAVKALSIASIVVISYSLIVQFFIQRTFCKICLYIIGVLVLQILLSIFFLNFNFDYTVLFLSGIAFLTIFSSVIFINTILKEKNDYKTTSLKNLRFKKNYGIFRRELAASEEINFKNPHSGFFFGNRDTKLHLSLVTNPYCGYCKDAHALLEKILKKYPDISAQIRFNYYPENADEKLTQLISLFKQIYDTQGQEEVLNAIEYWYANKDVNILKQKYNFPATFGDLSEIVEMAEENKRFGLSFTPAIIINQYQFPDTYDRADILFFIDELLDEMVEE